ncbi:primosomal replication protein N [Leeia aquatica]|uniref:Replication restart protein PriB n=1 Tax=Leeia aquatica TaxID=2725557 RepID=A0A847S6J5_9NEIS|nr:primosomal replication protein N [Leeia aquatica]NLR75383.1 primosomal replication protein N [Leeia aquatica]
MQASNQVLLRGKVQERQALAYTPAGTPVSRFQIAHQSVQVEAGRQREVQCTIEAVALGPLATELDRLPGDVEHTFSGFLAAKSLRYPRPILHVTAVLNETSI